MNPLFCLTLKCKPFILLEFEYDLFNVCASFNVMCQYDDEALDRVVKQNIPVEICLSCALDYFKVPSHLNPLAKIWGRALLQTSASSTHSDQKNHAISMSPQEGFLSRHENHLVSHKYSGPALILCTDNPALGDDHLSDEYEKACELYEFTADELFGLARQAVTAVFADSKTKKRLTNQQQHREQELRLQFDL